MRARANQGIERTKVSLRKSAGFALRALLLYSGSLVPVEAAELAIPTGYHVVFRSTNEFAPITVVCNAELEAARAEKLAHDVRNAYQFICETEKWQGLELLKPALQVRVNASMPKRSLGYAAKNNFTLGLSYIDKPLAQGTLAHELAHCQDRRQLNNRNKLPHYLAEGRALLVGRAYRQKLGQGPDSYDRGIRNAILKFTVRDAEEVLSEAPGKPAKATGAKVEFMGCFFVDFLRTQCGLPDIQPRTARIVMAMGQGMSYEGAFQQEIGMSLEEAKTKFIAFIKDNPGPARLPGTVWQVL